MVNIFLIQYINVSFTYIYHPCTIFFFFLSGKNTTQLMKPRKNQNPNTPENLQHDPSLAVVLSSRTNFFKESYRCLHPLAPSFLLLESDGLRAKSIGNFSSFELATLSSKDFEFKILNFIRKSSHVSPKISAHLIL